MSYNRYCYQGAVVILLLASIAISSSGYPESLNLSVTFSKEDLRFEKREGYDLVQMEDGIYITPPGEPMLPCQIINVTIPRGMDVESLKVTSKTSQELPGAYYIYPAQRPVPKSEPDDYQFVGPDPSVYNSLLPYPGKLIEVGSSGYSGGHHIVSLLVYPLQYIPSEKKLFLYEDIHFAMILKSSSEPPPKIRVRSRMAEEGFIKAIKRLVINPEDVESQIAEEIVNSPLQAGLLEYVIITQSTYFDEFQPLIEWKTKKGVSAALRDVNWIYANYGGWDHQEQIRNYIKQIEADSGAVWILLGGDTPTIPDRGVYCAAGEHVDTDMPCDSYYGNLGGTWDGDGDHTYGEVNDGVDFYPDVWVGRAMVNSEQEVTRFVNKVLTYEKTPPVDYQLKVLFFTAHLDAETDPKVLKEYIDDTYVPGRFDVDYLSDVNSNIVRDSLNQGYNLANHDGHGDWDRMYTYWSSSYLSRSQMSGLTNSPRITGVLYSCGCYCGAFDWYLDCVGEEFFQAENGGGFFIGNSRYGWGVPGNPLAGSSPSFDMKFFKSLFTDNIYNLGHTLGDSKSELAGTAQSDEYYRWVYYNLNLFGDPELPIWTDTPDPLNVSYPDTAFGGEPFTVTVSSGGSPVVDAIVCLWKEDEVHLVDLTNSGGEATFTPSPSTPGTLWVTVTKHNFIPYEGYAQADVPFVQFSADSTSGWASLPIQFHDETQGTIYSWLWKFGDGDTSTLQNPLHIYQQPGLFDVTLKVSGPGGVDSLTKQDYIRVWADTIIVENTVGSPGQNGKTVWVTGVNTDSLEGYSIAMYFDTSVLEVDTFLLEDTRGDGAMMVYGGHSVQGDTIGYLTVGVLYNYTPPFIPLGRGPILKVVFNIKENAPLGPTFLNLENDVGTGEADNTFLTWEDEEIYPVIVDGVLQVVEAPLFIRGDADNNLLVEMPDAVYILRYKFVPGSPPPDCMDAADADDNGALEMPDAIYILRYKFVPGSPPPPEPFPECGIDPTGDELGCDSHQCMGYKQETKGGARWGE